MTARLLLAAAERRSNDDDRPVGAEEADALRPLTESAHRLIGALEAGRAEPVLGAAVAMFAARAAERGISSRRIRDVLELLVHEHAVTHVHESTTTATPHVLEFVLRHAPDAGSGAAPHRREEA